MPREARVPHTHITQTRSPVTGCPACDLIRPDVMDVHPYALDPAVHGHPLSPERNN